MVLMNFMGMTVNDRPQVPQQVLIDRDGMIRYQTPPSGDFTALEESTLRSRLLEILGQTASRPKPPAAHSK